MNRRQRIIISVTGIFIVLLALIGLTYAYFLTRITGNTNTTSISVTTANLELKYGDGNGVLTPANMLVPGDAVKFIDSSGNEVESKTFTVTNEGNDTEYVVFMDNVTITNATSGETTTFLSNDFRYTLTCTITSSDTNRNNTSCNGVESGVLPLTNDSILVGNDIMAGDVHNYTLTMEYIETGVNQSGDMNKTLSALINIEDINRLNPYSDNTDSLVYNIINNAINKTNGTELMATPPTKVAEEVSYTKGTGEYELQELSSSLMPYGYSLWTVADTEAGAISGTSVSSCAEILAAGGYVYDQYGIISDVFYVESCSDDGRPMVNLEINDYEKVLAVTPDDYGTSYYYRGNVEDNYVNFAGMCWRVVRIAGDGSTKLILEDSSTTCGDTETEITSAVYTGNWSSGIGNYGYELKDINGDSSNEYIMNYLNPVTDATSSMVKAFYDFQTGKLADYTGKLKAGEWCLGDKAYTRSGSSGSYTYTLLEEYDYSLTMYYDAYTRLTSGNANGYQPTLKCNGTVLDKFATVSGISSEAPMYVATLTADEIVFAGGTVYGGNENYYLINNFQKSDYTWPFWLLSPDSFDGYSDNAFLVQGDGTLGSNEVYTSGSYENNSFRPAVSLIARTQISSGNGTISNPYVVE